MTNELGWSDVEEAKIQELMNTPVELENGKSYKPERPEAIRIMRRLQQAGKWNPEDQHVQTV